MNCPVCGKAVENGNKFCIWCGAMLKQNKNVIPNIFDLKDYDKTELIPYDEYTLSKNNRHANQTINYDYQRTSLDSEPVQSRSPVAPPDHSENSMVNNGEVKCYFENSIDSPRSVDPSERHELVFLTRSELVNGCTKELVIDDRAINIKIPPGMDLNTRMVIDDCGYIDKRTGKRGKLKIQFVID